jgi:hypothetical protein
MRFADNSSMSRKDWETMPRASIWLSALGSTCLLVGGVLALTPPKPIAVTAKTDTSVTIAPEDRDMQTLLARVSQYSEYILHNSESKQVYRHQIAQGDTMLQVAVRCKNAKERDHWLRMAVDMYQGAMVSSPENDLTAHNRLLQVRAEIAGTYPGCAVATYAGLQEIQADYLRVLTKNGDKPNQAQEHRCQRLVHFATENRNDPDSPKVIMEAAHTYESLNKTEDARRCYRYLADTYPTILEGRKAGGCLWRMGLSGEAVTLKLPLLFPTPDPEENEYNIATARGKVVVVYFWSCKCGQVEEDMQALKHLTDRFQYRGVEVVYVNLDDDTKEAKAFLAGRLNSGAHVFQKGGLGSPVAERYGLQALPQTFLVGMDGSLLHHSLPTAQVELEVSARLPRSSLEKTQRRW